MLLRRHGSHSTVGVLPVGSAAAGTAVLDDRIIYFGGETAETALNTTWALEPEAFKWTRLANMQQGRHGSQAVVHEGHVYIAGGSPKRGGGNLSSIQMFAPVTSAAADQDQTNGP